MLTWLNLYRWFVPTRPLSVPQLLPVFCRPSPNLLGMCSWHQIHNKHDRRFSCIYWTRRVTVLLFKWLFMVSFDFHFWHPQVIWQLGRWTPEFPCPSLSWILRCCFQPSCLPVMSLTRRSHKKKKKHTGSLLLHMGLTTVDPGRGFHSARTQLNI